MRNYLKEIAAMGIDINTKEWMEMYKKLTDEDALRQHTGK